MEFLEVIFSLLLITRQKEHIIVACILFIFMILMELHINYQVAILILIIKAFK